MNLQTRNTRDLSQTHTLATLSSVLTRQCNVYGTMIVYGYFTPSSFVYALQGASRTPPVSANLTASTFGDMQHPPRQSLRFKSSVSAEIFKWLTQRPRGVHPVKHVSTSSNPRPDAAREGVADKTMKTLQISPLCTHRTEKASMIRTPAPPLSLELSSNAL